MTENIDNFAIFTNAAMTGNLASKPVDSALYGLVSIQAIWTGSPVGNFFIETSNDVGVLNPDGSVGGLVNWTTYTGSLLVAGGVAGNWFWHIEDAGFKWVRLSYAFTSGSGTLNARVNQKG